MPDKVILQDVSKRYRLYPPTRPWTLQEAVLRGWRDILPKEDFLALDKVSFRLSMGTMLGIIGENGAGKSTLLRLIGGVGEPDSGFITVNGRIGALLDLGVGFHPELTGRENIFVNGVISGLTRQEIKQRFEKIVEFAELESFIDSPLHTYSSGMQMRLAFSVAIHVDPEILLIDEVLAVGDIRFQAKCLDQIKKYRSEGCTILFVTHDYQQVKELCDEAFWLSSGRIVARGSPDSVVNQYLQKMKNETQPGKPLKPAPILATPRMGGHNEQNRSGYQEMQIAAIHLYDHERRSISEIESGDPLWIEIEYISPKSNPLPIFEVTITRDDGQLCLKVNTEAVTELPPRLEGDGKVILNLERLDLVGGQYYIEVRIFKQDMAFTYDYQRHAETLKVHQPEDRIGVLQPPHQWKFKT